MITVSYPLSPKLQNSQYNIIDYNHHAVHYISMTFFYVQFNFPWHFYFMNERLFFLTSVTNFPHPHLQLPPFWLSLFSVSRSFILFSSFVLFLNQPRWLIFPVLDSTTEIPVQGLSPSTLREDLRVCDIPLLFWVPHRGVVLTWKSLLPSYQTPCGSFFIILVVEELFCQSSCHSQRELLYIQFDTFMRGGGLRVFLFHHLDPTSIPTKPPQFSVCFTSVLPYLQLYLFFSFFSSSVLDFSVQVFHIIG